ncbi:MAG: lysophospholipid acyltransferase family protein [Cyanobacteria bacterium P01_D01_bin.128]
MGLRTERFFYHLARAIASPFVKGSVQIEVVGLAHLPSTGGAILVSNHRSDIDPSVLSVAIPRYVAWIAAAYMAKVTPMNWLIGLTGAVLVDVAGNPSASSLKQALNILHQGGLLGIFPEGEDYIFANDFAAPLAAFHRGFALLAVKAKVPVIPVVLVPIEETLEPIQIPEAIRADIERVQDLDQLKQIARYRSVRVVIGKPIDPANYSGASKVQMQQLTQHTRQAMQRLVEAGS